MTKALNALGYGIGRWETRRLMKKSHIFVRYQKKYKLTRNNNHQPLYVTMFYNANLRLIKPNKAYVSHITYVWTQVGCLYLMVMIDIKKNFRLAHEFPDALRYRMYGFKYGFWFKESY